MDPIEPWIDAEAVRRLARQLTAPAGKGVPNQAGDPGFGPGFEGFIEGKEHRAEPTPAPAAPADPHRPMPKAEVSQAVAQEPARQAESAEAFHAQAVPVVTRHSDDEPKPFLINQPGKAAQPRPLESSGERGPLVARMERFRQWLAEKVDARGMFVLDRDGNPVVDDPVYGKLHFLARSLAQAYRPADGGAGNVHVKIGSDSYLAVVPVRTDFGSLVLGTVLPKPLEAAAVDAIARGLEQSLRPERR